MLSKVIRAISPDETEIEHTFFHCQSDECELRKGVNCFGCDMYDPTKAEHFDVVMSDPKTCKGRGNLPEWREHREHDFRLNDEELEMYKRNGFVVCGRKSVRSFGEAYDMIQSDDMPVYITSDSVLHAWFLSFYNMKRDLKEHLFLPTLQDILHVMNPVLKELKQKSTADTYMEKCLKECDKLISVARSFLKGAPAKPVFDENRPFVCDILDAINDQKVGKFTIFGKESELDFSIFSSQGRFSKHMLRDYHKAMYWLGNVNIALGEEGSTFELACATTLLKILEMSGALERKIGIDKALSLFVGETRLMGFEDLHKIYSTLDIDYQSLTDESDFQDLKKQFAAYHHADDDDMKEKVFGFVRERFSIERWSLEVEAESYNKTPCSFKYHLEVARAQGNPSLRTLWFAVLRTLSEPAAHPSEAFHTKGWTYRLLTTQMASYTQLRNFSRPNDDLPEELISMPQYTDGFVEPRPLFWEAMHDLVSFTAELLQDLPEPMKHKKERTRDSKCCQCITKQITSYLTTFQNQMSQFGELARLQIKEANNELSPDLRATWLAKVCDRLHNDLGWYGSLFYQGVEHAIEPVATVAGYCHKRKGEDKYLRDGVGDVLLCVLSVEAGPHVNCYVGPVFSHYQFEQTEPTDICNAEWQKLVKCDSTELETKPVLPGWCEQYVVANQDDRDVCVIS